MIKTILKDLFDFIKSPKDQQITLSLQNKIKFIFILLLFELIFTFIIIFPLGLGIGAITTLKVDRFDYSETFLEILFVYVFLVPFIEELIFRYFLRYQGLKKRFINLSTWNTIFPYLVYTLCIGFGFIHISNFLNDDQLFYILSPFIVLTQLFGGLIITFIRVRINFMSAVLYHCIWNFIFAIIIPLFLQYFSKDYTEKTQHYQITISEQSFYNHNKKQIYKIDSLDSKIKEIKVQQLSLQHLLDTLYVDKKYYVDDVLINLTYQSEKGLTKKEFLDVLRKEYDIE